MSVSGTQQAESEQKCNEPIGWCEIYALKLTHFPYRQTAWIFTTEGLTLTLHPYLLYTFTLLLYKFPGDTDSAGPSTILGEPLL